MEAMLLRPGIAADAQLFACHDTWFKTILAQFSQENFAKFARKPLKQYKTLSSSFRNTCVPVRIPRRYLFVFVCDSSAPAMSCLFTLVFLFGLSFHRTVLLGLSQSGISYSAWAFVARVFLLGLSQSGISNSAWAFVARVFLLGLSQSGISNFAWAFVARVFLLASA